MIDFHTHVLPQIDDGAKSVDESLMMLQKCAVQGINRVIATSHFYAEKESPAQFCKRREKSYKMLNEAITDCSLPQISLGAEVLYFEGMSDCDDLELLKIDGTRVILIEMPFENWSPRMIDEVASIFEKRNLVPLIAHIDRYINLFNKRSIVKAFDNLPVLVQANADFFISKKTARFAQSLLKKGKVHLLGSDCHNMTTRNPDLKTAYDTIRKNLGNNAIMQIEAYEDAVFEHDNEILLSYMFE